MDGTDPGGDSDTDGDTDSDSDGDTDTDSDGDSDTDSDNDSDSDTDIDTDSDSDSDSDTSYVDEDSDGWIDEYDCDETDSDINPGVEEIFYPPNGIDEDCDGLTDEVPGEPPPPELGDEMLEGIVKSTSGFPIPGALIYLTQQDGVDIPDGAYAQECDEVIEGQWTLSNADGTWAINTAPNGTYNIVSRKGNFQRQREIIILDSDDVQVVPQELTTLPGANSADGLDQIPNYAVLINLYDQPENLLAKMGLGDVTINGILVPGTEQFALYEDHLWGGAPPENAGDWSDLLANQESLNQYHMIFFPCNSSFEIDPASTPYVGMLRDYVSIGGKIYASCNAARWVEDTFPDVIDYFGGDGYDDDSDSPGGSSQHDTRGIIEDDGLRAWLDVMVPDEDPDDFPFTHIVNRIDELSYTSYDGHGLVVNEDGSWFNEGPVTPFTWVTDNVTAVGTPLAVTYTYDAGKVFFPTFHVVTGPNQAPPRPQEWVLIYMFYEVGVCEGDIVEIPPPT